MQRVALVTLSRSDYASLRPVARTAFAHPGIEAHLIAGGSHLLSRFGETIGQIRADGFKIARTLNFLLENDDTPAQLAAAYAKAVAESVAALRAIDPDKLFIVGDRWEMLAPVTAASMLHIPVVHHSGGDITQGSADNQTRYALTTLSHLHLTALEEHTTRLRKMGEEDWRVITTGEPALTELATYAAAAGDIRAALNIAPGAPFVLATFHPTSFDALPPQQQVERFLSALESIPERIILTAPNPDAASDLFLRNMQAFAATRPNVSLHQSLGTGQYYAAMEQAEFMIGNSSSGLWEAPSFALPVINIGPRQQGRVHGENVINVPLDVSAITGALTRAKNMRGALTRANPYVREDTLSLITNELAKPYPRAQLLAKRFIDPLA